MGHPIRVMSPCMHIVGGISALSKAVESSNSVSAFRISFLSFLLTCFAISGEFEEDTHGRRIIQASDGWGLIWQYIQQRPSLDVFRVRSNLMDLLTVGIANLACNG